MAKIPTDSNLVSPMGNMEFAVAIGAIKGYEIFRKFGMNAAVQATGVAEDIWEQTTAAVKTMPAATPAVCAVVSTSAEDDENEATPPGTGAWSVKLEGLDTDYNRITETVALQGLTPVNTTQTFLHIDRAYVVECGSTGSNVGEIRGTISGAAQFFIPAVEGQTQQMQYIVPAGKTLLLDSYHIGCGRMSGNVDMHIQFQINLYDSTVNNNYQGWRVASDMYLFNGENIAYEKGTVFLPEKSMFRCQAISTVATQVYAEVAGYLIDNATQGNFA